METYLYNWLSLILVTLRIANRFKEVHALCIPFSTFLSSSAFLMHIPYVHMPDLLLFHFSVYFSILPPSAEGRGRHHAHRQRLLRRHADLHL